MMGDLGRILIFIGGILILLGLGAILVGKIPWVGKLPGDIIIKKENFSFYFPLTTCLILSALLSLILFLWHRK